MQSGLTVELWDELRSYAQRCAVSDEPLPHYAQCRDWLSGQIERRRLAVAPDVLAFYAGELHSMIHQLREELQSL